MTVRMLKAWNGHSLDDIVSTFPAAEETRLIGIGFASADLDGADNDDVEFDVRAKLNPLNGRITFSAGAVGISVPAGVQTDQIKAVATIGNGYMYVRYPWDAVYDAVSRVRVYSTDPTINGCVDFFGVRVIPLGTANTAAAIDSAFPSGTVIASQTDSIGPLYYNNTYIGANHGPFVGHTVTAAAHGKTSVDIGSEWNGPESRKLYIIKVVDANTLLMISDNTGLADHWSFYLTTLAAQTLTHAYGAAHTTSIVISADTPTTQITPILSNRTLQVIADGVVIDHTLPAGIWTPKTLSIVEKYSITSPSAAVAYIRSKAGSNPKFNDDSIFTDVAISNVHNFFINGCHTVDQTVSWNSAVILSYFGTVQDVPPINTGVMTQYIPGVGLINAVDYKAGVDISGTLTIWKAMAANWLDAANPPNRMAQIVSIASVNQYGIVVGYSPLTGIGTRTKRILNCDNAGGQASAATKKQYPRACSGIPQPAAGNVQRVVGYHHVYNSKIVPDATVATWFKDGDDYVVVLDFHKISAISRVPLPAACDGFSVRMVDSSNVNLLTDTVIDGGGVAVACTATYGYALIRVSPL